MPQYPIKSNDSSISRHSKKSSLIDKQNKIVYSNYSKLTPIVEPLRKLQNKQEKSKKTDNFYNDKEFCQVDEFTPQKPEIGGRFSNQFLMERDELDHISRHQYTKSCVVLQNQPGPGRSDFHHEISEKESNFNR